MVCLTSDQAKFFLKQNVIAKSLQVDTMLLKMQLRDCEGILHIQTDENNGCNFALKQATQAADNYRLNYSTLQEKYDHKIHVLKIFRKVVFWCVAFIVAEAAVIYFILKL